MLFQFVCKKESFWFRAMVWFSFCWSFETAKLGLVKIRLRLYCMEVRSFAFLNTVLAGLAVQCPAVKHWGYEGWRAAVLLEPSFDKQVSHSSGFSMKPP